jgi:lipid-A-disaccharide synthase-like uncharacterized protein
MTGYNLLVYALGLLAQLLFSARILVQWIKSEKAGHILSPNSFWITSLVASLLLMLYGVLRNDVVIIGGQLLSYYIYLRNLYFKQLWQKIPRWMQGLILALPLLALGALIFVNQYLFTYHYSFAYFKAHSRISATLLAWGGLGQVVFTLRFVYQWYYSERRQESVIPTGFWLLSLVGSVMIVTYALFRSDPVLVIGQLFGLVAYGRNLVLGLRNRTAEAVPNLLSREPDTRKWP